MEIGDRLSAGKKLSAASQNDEGAAGRIGHFAWNAMRGTLAARASSLDSHVMGDAVYAATGNDYRGEFRALKEAWVLAGTGGLGFVEAEAERQNRKTLVVLTANTK